MGLPRGGGWLALYSLHISSAIFPRVQPEACAPTGVPQCSRLTRQHIGDCKTIGERPLPHDTSAAMRVGKALCAHNRSHRGGPGLWQTPNRPPDSTPRHRLSRDRRAERPARVFPPQNGVGRGPDRNTRRRQAGRHPLCTGSGARRTQPRNAPQDSHPAEAPPHTTHHGRTASLARRVEHGRGGQRQTPRLGRFQICFSGRCTTSPSSAGVTLIWQVRREVTGFGS